ncbi:MAG: anaerobic ribonucleoside-triphosphate reductase activating protein [Thermodesulfobacteriota bacterium]|nr:anaerobic ribonucleoside-triphosphate reductase activating protein [Thermodesulfobacteriota bacterium]
MAIKGFQGTSLLDFPGRVASLIFYGGCNLSCPFCHNPALVQNPHHYPDIPIADVMAMLEQRCGFIDGVVISGGEPTLDPDLAVLLRQIKQLELQVKLDTNGLRPAVLESLLDQRLLDYVGIDIKTALPRYTELHHSSVDVDAVMRSVMLLKQVDIEVEFRTTCVPGLVEEDEIHAVGALLHGAPLWVLQQFVAETAMAPAMQQCAPHSVSTLGEFAIIAEGYVGKVFIRGI